MHRVNFFRRSWILYSTSLILLLSSFTLPAPAKITIWLIGDSTLSIKEKTAYPETGWGMPFVNFFDATVVVKNLAKNGRSTGSFIKEGLWQPVLEQLKSGDYVFIQFGHNDEVKTKKSYTTEAEFQANLLKYISESRSKKAIPVLLTPVSRRSFDETGRLIDTHLVYAKLVRDVATAQNVPLIDLNQSSQLLLQQMGVDDSKYLFNHLTPGEHPNYPAGKEDNTHFNELGARRVAELVLAGIQSLKLELADRIIKVKNPSSK
jgi:lysophospholipase L1-like esterase